MDIKHHYEVNVKWEGNNAEGTKNIRTYTRNHIAKIGNKPELHLTTDNKAVGDANKLNPEDLLVTAIASCHMLSYLYVCSLDGIVVLDYTDKANGLMTEKEKGGGSFDVVELNPVVIVADESMIEKAIELHHKAHEICYIANSVNFEVRCNPVCKAINK